MGKFVAFILTCLILSHGITGVQSDSETDETSDGESKKGLDPGGKSKSESKNELGKKFEGESEEKEKGSAKKGSGENEDAAEKKEGLDEKKPESKNEKSSAGKEADGGKGEGADKPDKGKAGQKHAPQKAPHRKPGTASPDVENMIHEEASRVRGEELEQTESERNPDMVNQENAGPNGMTPEEAAEKAKKKAEEKEADRAAAAKEAADAKTTMSPEEEQNNGEMEKEVMEQSARERGKELAETEEDREKNPEPAVDFSKEEKKVEKDTDKKEVPDKSKPEKEEKEESEKSGDSPKGEKTSPKDEDKPSLGKSESSRGDDKSQFGRNVQERGKVESQNEGSSFRDMEKGNFGKFESGKDDQKAETFQSDQDTDRDELEMENAFMEEGERAKREKKAPADKIHEAKPGAKNKHKAAEVVEAKTKESKEHTPKTSASKSKTGKTGAVETPSAEDDRTISTESRSVSQCIMNDLPQELREKIQETNDAEDLVLSSYVTSEQVPFKIIHGYQTAKVAERTFLKELLPELGPEADGVLAAYRALRKGIAWNYVAHDQRYKEFFRKPSTALTLYRTLKADENNTLDRFLTSAQTFNDTQSVTGNASEVQTVDLKKRSFAGDSDAAAASAKRERSGEVLHRGISATGVESMGDSGVMDGAKGRYDTSEKAIQVPELDDESSSEEATTKFSDKQTINFKSNLVKCLILFSVIAQMIVVFIVAIACRIEVVKWSEKQKKTHHDKDTEPSHGYSRIEDDDETDTKEESANFSISVTTVGGADHNQP